MVTTASSLPQSQPAVSPKINSVDPSTQRFILEQSNFIKLAFVRVLQVVFSSPTIPPEYRWDPIRERRQLAIFRAWPKAKKMVPAILVESDIADVSIKTLGDEPIAQEFEPDGITVKTNIFGGVMWIPVKLTVLARTTTDREIITDIASSYIRFAARDRFAQERIDYLDIRAGDAGEDEVDGRPAHVGTVDIQVQTEYRAPINMEIFTAIQKIQFVPTYEVDP